MKAEELMLLNCGVEQVSCESLNCKEIKPVNPKGNQSWIAEAETPILWPPDAKNWLSGKDPDGGKYRRQDEMGPTENAMFGWHYWLNGCEFEKVQEWVGDGQGSLACCSPWGRKERGTTEQLNWTAGWLHQFSLRLLVWLLGRPIYPPCLHYYCPHFSVTLRGTGSCLHSAWHLSKCLPVLTAGTDCGCPIVMVFMFPCILWSSP